MPKFLAPKDADAFIKNYKKKNAKKPYAKKPYTKKPYAKKPYTKRAQASKYVNYVKPGSMQTNDKHFDEKIAKSEIIMNQISRGMDVAAKPIQGLLELAEKYAGKAGSFIGNLFTKKK